jgi:hypothetical protein
MLENVFLNTDFDFVYNIIYISEKCTTHMHGREYIPDYISLLELKLLLRLHVSGENISFSISVSLSCN